MAASTTEILLVAFILVLPFLYEMSKVFRYYFKFFVYYGIIMCIAVMVIPIMMWRPRDVKNLHLASSICRHISSFLGLKWELRGREYLEQEQACIIVANHQSSLDILGMFDIWRIMDKCTVVAKKELFYAWPFGIAAWLCGLIFIDRMNSHQARLTINAAIDHIKEKKIKLWVFPEGTRRNTGEIHSFKKGAFHVAIAAQIPILPVVFSSYHFLDCTNKQLDQETRPSVRLIDETNLKKTWVAMVCGHMYQGNRKNAVDDCGTDDEPEQLGHYGNIVITTLPPIITEGLNKSNVEDLMNKTRSQMLDVFKSTSDEMQFSLLKPIN